MSTSWNRDARVGDSDRWRRVFLVLVVASFVLFTAACTSHDASDDQTSPALAGDVPETPVRPSATAHPAALPSATPVLEAVELPIPRSGPSIAWPQEFDLVNQTSATMQWQGFFESSPPSRWGGDHDVLRQTFAPVDEWDQRDVVYLIMTTGMANGAVLEETALDNVAVSVRLTVTDDVALGPAGLTQAWVDCGTVLVGVSELEAGMWDHDVLIELAAQVGASDCGRGRPMNPQTGQTIFGGRQPSDPFSASGLFSVAGEPVAISSSGAYGYYARLPWVARDCDSTSEGLRITGYNVAAAEDGDPPLFNADPTGIVLGEAQNGSALLDMAFVSDRRALVVLRCGSDVTVLDVTVDTAGQLSGLTDEVSLSGIAAVDGYLESRVLVDEQALSIFRIDVRDESADRSITEVRVYFADGNRVESMPTSTLAVGAPGTDLRFATEMTPFIGGEGGSSWRFIVDATDDGLDNFSVAEYDPWVRYSVGRLGPWFGPEERIVWLSTLDRSASMSIARYEADGHLVDVHNPVLVSASAWARGEVNPWQIAFTPDGRLLALGNVRTFYGSQGAPGIPAHAWYDLGSDPEWLNSGRAEPVIDRDMPVVEFDESPDWFLGQETEVTVTESPCSNSLFFDGPDGVERVLPTGVRLGTVVDTLVGERRASEWSDAPDLEAWDRTVLVLAQCPADGDGYRLWRFHTTPWGVWASRSIGTVKGISRLVGAETEYDAPLAEVVLMDGTTAVLPETLFESVDPRNSTGTAVVDQSITRAMIDSPSSWPSLQTPYIHNVYSAIGGSLASFGFEPSPPKSSRGEAIHGELIAVEPNVASLLVGVELEPVLSDYVDAESVDGVIFFYPPENDVRIAKRVAFWCGTSLVSLTSTGGVGAPYGLGDLREFATEISVSCPR